ncbi:MAG: hypothetical protein M3N95_08640 [Actinomycetota bacterium]|nr:hypothetical protein [Actinomycetota bacterium]
MTFDSHAPIGTGPSVYISATTRQVGTDNLTHAIETFSQRWIRWPARAGADALRSLAVTKLTALEIRAVEAMSKRSGRAAGASSRHALVDPGQVG